MYVVAGWAKADGMKPKHWRARQVAMRSLVFIAFVHFMGDGLGGTHGVAPAKPALLPLGRKV